MVERGLKAEYLLKSATNFARALIQYDESPNVDSKKDIWADKILPFSQGVKIPAELLQISDPGVSIALEIRPVDATIPLRAVAKQGGVSTATQRDWRGVLTRVCEKLGFDNDQVEDHTGLFPGRVFGSKEMVAALIDYIDRDEDSFTSNDFEGTGIEAQLGKDSPFRNDDNLERVTELSIVPGFAPERMKKLLPFVRPGQRGTKVNINFVPRIILSSLSEDLSEKSVDLIIAHRDGEGGPFGENSPVVDQELKDVIGEDDKELIKNLVALDSSRFQVVAKVELAGSVYFMRTVLKQQSRKIGGEPPKIVSVEIF
jgi:hypothetical protein